MARIQLYTTRWCGYCVRAKTLLESRGISFEEISLDDDPDFRRRLLDLTGGWTVPQIVIDGRPIGG
jgi:glutaredoxin 3